MKLSMFRRQPKPADLAPVPVPAPAAPKPAPAPDPVVSAVLTLPPAPRSAVPAAVFQPGRYTVAYDRVGRYGDRRTGLLAPAPLTVVAASAADLAEQIRTDIAPYLGGDRIEITIDMVVCGGKIAQGSISGTFTFARGGAR